MDAPSFLTADYTDILFDKRNKSYGGYELRTHYPERIRKALLFVTLFCLLLAALVFLLKPEPADRIIFDGSVVMTDMQPFAHPPAASPPPAPKPPAAPTQAGLKISADKDVPREKIPDEVASSGGQGPQDGTGTGEGTGSETGNPGPSAEGGGPKEPVEKIIPPPVVRYASKMPAFEGVLGEYLSRHLRYPSMARENNISGKVLVEFIIDENGMVTDVHLKKGIGGGCDEEALRVVTGMPRWQPGENNGKPVKVLLLLPIMFRLE